jgi:hypothetical protein
MMESGNIFDGSLKKERRVKFFHSCGKFCGNLSG